MLPYWAVLVLAVVAANAGAWTDTSVLVTNVRNFPNQRGKVVGEPKTLIFTRALSPVLLCGEGPRAFHALVHMRAQHSTARVYTVGLQYVDIRTL